MTTPMPPDFPELVEQTIADHPDLTIAEAYWTTAAVLIEEMLPAEPITGARVDHNGRRWRARWRQGTLARQRTFNTELEADTFLAQLQLAGAR